MIVFIEVLLHLLRIEKNARLHDRSPRSSTFRVVIN